MTGQESLRWLLWYMNFSGLVPFHMEINRQTKKFERFAFSYCHVATWWYCLVILFELSLMIWFTIMGSSSFTSFVQSQSSLTILSMVLQSFSFLTSANSPRLIIFYYKRLAEASLHLKTVDERIESTGSWSNNSKYRVLVGILLLFAFGIVFIITSWASLEALFPDQTVFYFVAIIYSVLTFSHTGGFYLLFYLSYYTIAHRLEILAALLAGRQSNSNRKATIQPDSIEQNPWNSKSTEEQLRTLKRLYLCLSESAENLSSSLSLITLTMVTVKIITLATAMFLTALPIIKPSEISKMNPISLLTITLEASSLLIIFMAADMPAKKVKALHREVMKCSNQPMKESEKLEVIAFQTQISEEHFELVAGGQFRVGLRLIPSLTGVVLTYIIILLQAELDH